MSSGARIFRRGTEKIKKSQVRHKNKISCIYTDFCTINRVVDGANGEPGKDGVVYTVDIVSSAGLIFKNNTGTTTLTCYVYNGNNEVTSGITYQWKKGDTILAGQTNKTLEVSAEDIDTTQVYNCVVTLADV